MSSKLWLACGIWAGTILFCAVAVKAQTYTGATPPSTYKGGLPPSTYRGGSPPSTRPSALAAPATAPSGATVLKPEELEQIVAPIALYPDSLLAQVFMAAT